MRNKALSIEAIAVMLLLIIFAATVFIVLGAGSGAFDTIVSEKKNTESARVAYAYINMKIKQNDAAGSIDVVKTDFGNALCIGGGDDFVTYIFFADGTLYECVTKEDMEPQISASNPITNLAGFDISRDGAYIRLLCLASNGDKEEEFGGIVGLRT